MNVLVLYDANATYTNTVREYLESFELYSKNRVFYAPATNRARCWYDLSHFDAILIHYSVRLCYDWHVSPFFTEEIAKARACKVLFIQDEYDYTAVVWSWIRRLGVKVVFTCVPEESLREVYPAGEVPGVEFVPTLTGWVSPELERIEGVKPLGERGNWINYRGRNLPVWYGDLAREKMEIGVRMRAECDRRGIPCDIEWTEESRIYGAVWWDFLMGARTTLGSESGANVFDFRGEIRGAIQADMERNPGMGYEELHARHIGKEDGRIRMNQVSPRVFEAAALGTGLILFRGRYSGVVAPEEHYIPLEKDFSNVDAVFERLADLGELQKMVDRCRADIIGSGRYSYRAFVRRVDGLLDEAAGGCLVGVSTLRVLEELQREGNVSFRGILGRAVEDASAAIRFRWSLAMRNPGQAFRRAMKRFAGMAARVVCPWRMRRRAVKGSKAREAQGAEGRG